MTRKARDAAQSTWGVWGTPYLNDDPRPQTPPQPEAARLLSPEAIRRAIQAEEQRQVFALLGRLRRGRPS
ncbi:hypothetical protein GO986_01555 [Deinococcus sp. HMF7620]|uniref:Uncharacterized protein n=1 Tax=Deinococcus arboris TaxID=2682977 RepID=A0A7C9HPK8_9DEIO|nr:hypothetical protein [Deinococcus arboris]MVN85449.1 hypothetical protein [Deinococcus arboris]